MLRKICLLGLLALILFGCKESPVSGDYIPGENNTVIYKGQKNNDIHVHVRAEPKNLHPAERNVSSNYLFIVQYIHQNLLRTNIETGELIGLLTQGLPTVSDDKLRYYFTLDPIAAWEDGSPITAQDVAFSLKVHFSPLANSSAIASHLNDFAGMEFDSPESREFVFSFNNATVLTPYFATLFYIIDRRIYDPEGMLDKYTLTQLVEEKEKVMADEGLKTWTEGFYGEDFLRSPEYVKGSGPYELERWDPEQQIVLKRKEKYWGKDKKGFLHQQKPERIIFKPAQNDQTIELEIKNQNLDFSMNLSSTSFTQLQESPSAQEHYHIIGQTSDQVSMILLNLKPDGNQRKPIFSNPEVREAISRAIPREEIIEQFMKETSKLSNSLIPETHPDAAKNLPLYPYDLAYADSLLTANGWTDSDGDQVRDKVIKGNKIPLQFSLQYPSSPLTDNYFNIVKSSIEQIGVQCELEPSSTRDMARRLYAHDFDAAALGLPALPLPYPFEQMWLSTGWPEGGNFTGYENPEVDDLIQKARVEFDPVKRRKMAHRIQEIFHAETAFIPLFNTLKKVAIHKRFSHAKFNPIRFHVALNAWEVIRK